jgi:hypothetical protein
MRLRSTSTGNVLSIMVSAVAVGLAVGIPLGFVARYFDVAPFNLGLASVENQQKQSQVVVNSSIK